MKKITLYFLPLFFLLACDPSSKNSDNKPAPVITYKSLGLQNSYGDCNQEDKPCATFNVTRLIQFKDGKENQAWSDTLEDYILKGVPTDFKIHTLQEGWLAFQQEMDHLAKKHKTDDPESFRWFFKADADTLGCFPGLVSYRIGFESFKGGAHPNAFCTIINGDPDHFNNLRWSDILKDSLAFVQLAEKTFREKEQIAPEQSLEEAGLLIEKFVLPQYFGFSQNGLVLEFNPYEAGPWAKGPIQWTIPASALDGMLKVNPWIKPGI